MLKLSLAQLKAADALAERCADLAYSKGQERNVCEKTTEDIFFWVLHRMNKELVSSIDTSFKSEIELRFELQRSELTGCFEIVNATYSTSSNDFKVLKEIMDVDSAKKVMGELAESFNQIPDYTARVCKTKGEGLLDFIIRLDVL